MGGRSVVVVYFLVGVCLMGRLKGFFLAQTSIGRQRRRRLPVDADSFSRFSSICASRGRGRGGREIIPIGCTCCCAVRCFVTWRWALRLHTYAHTHIQQCTMHALTASQPLYLPTVVVVVALHTAEVRNPQVFAVSLCQDMSAVFRQGQQSRIVCRLPRLLPFKLVFAGSRHMMRTMR